MLQVQLLLPAPSCHSSIACAVDLGLDVSLLSAGKAVASGVFIGLRDDALLDINMDAQTVHHSLSATWQGNGHMQVLWCSSRHGSIQVPGHMPTTSLAVYHAPDCNATGQFLLSGILLASKYALCCPGITACLPGPVHISQVGSQGCFN